MFFALDLWLKQCYQQHSNSRGVVFLNFLRDKYYLENDTRNSLIWHPILFARRSVKTLCHRDTLHASRIRETLFASISFFLFGSFFPLSSCLSFFVFLLLVFLIRHFHTVDTCVRAYVLEYFSLFFSCAIFSSASSSVRMSGFWFLVSLARGLWYFYFVFPEARMSQKRTFLLVYFFTLSVFLCVSYQ